MIGNLTVTTRIQLVAYIRWCHAYSRSSNNCGFWPHINPGSYRCSCALPRLREKSWLLHSERRRCGTGWLQENLSPLAQNNPLIPSTVLVWCPLSRLSGGSSIAYVAEVNTSCRLCMTIHLVQGLRLFLPSSPPPPLVSRWAPWCLTVLRDVGHWVSLDGCPDLHVFVGHSVLTIGCSDDQCSRSEFP